MVWIKQLKVVGVLMVLAGIVTACSISYKFNGSSIDYTKVRIMRHLIKELDPMAILVW